MKIVLGNGAYKLIDQVSWKEEKQCGLKEIFRDGVLLVNQTLSEIRQRGKLYS